MSEPEPPQPPADPATEPAVPAEPAESEDSPLRRFMGLFVVPLLVVLASVAVFIGFGWIAYDSAELSDYLNDLRTGSKPRRAQAAYELSKILVADPDALDKEPAAKAEVRRIFEKSEEKETRRYLALVLGYTGDAESLPLLVAALDDEDSQTRIYALLALGALGDERALEPLAESLGDPDPGIRKTAAYSLGQLATPQAVDPLIPLLSDGVADVRWNAALSLARLGSDAGVEVLERMLDRRLTSQVPGIKPEQQDDAMVSAAQALAALGRAEAVPTLRTLADEDPSLKVRQAAIAALEALEEG